MHDKNRPRAMMLERLSSRRHFFTELFQDVQQESREHVNEHPAMDWAVMIVLLTAAISLTLQYYVFPSANAGWAMRALENSGAGWLLRLAAGGTSQDQLLAGLMYWATGALITYALIPAAVIKLVFRQRLRDYGLRLRGTLASSWTYLVMFLAIFPCLLYFSHSSSFQAKYPFYKLAPEEVLWPRFWIWELFYAAQFFALEFFFRGFLLHGARKRFGFYSIFVMTVPYCMIHFGKPMPETFGAIGAGVILGFMSLKTRSIWLGAAVHVAVALSMDLLALRNTGLLP